VIKSRDKAAEETLQLEHRASEAGSTALALAAEISQLHDELALLQSEKTHLTETVAEISEIITAKDAEFHDVLSKIETASARLKINTLVLQFLIKEMHVRSLLLLWCDMKISTCA